MEKLLAKCRIGENVFEFFGKLEGGNIFEPCPSHAMRNKQPLTDFGESWYGIQVSACDALCGLFASYFNDDTMIQFIEVCDELKSYKAQKQSYSTIVSPKGRRIPNVVVVTPLGEEASLIAVNEDGGAYYIGENEVFVFAYPEGAIGTDMECFFTNAFLSDLENGSFVFMTEIAQEFAKQYSE